MNIYEKIQIIKSELNRAKLKKSGENKFAGYKYYELADFLPQIVELCKDNGILTFISFTADLAILTAVNSEKPEEQIKITSPMKEIEQKGCNAIQSLGGVETYQRRYLYMALFDIVENDMFDGADPKQNEKPTKPNYKEELKKAMNEKVKQGMTAQEVVEKLHIFNSAKEYTTYTDSECQQAIEFLKVLE